MRMDDDGRVQGFLERSFAATSAGALQFALWRPKWAGGEAGSGPATYRT